MSKRPANRLLNSGAAEAGRAQARQAEHWLQQERAERGEFPLSAITPRPGGDTRPLNPTHVLGLAESIAAVGLVEPPVVDREGRLLAGAHRLAALRLLAIHNTEDRLQHWLRLTVTEVDRLTPHQREQVERLISLSPLAGESIPVMVLPFDAAEDPARALAVETSENTQRRSYSKAEITSLTQRLREAGYVEREGRPRVGEKALRPALSIIIGKSPNTVRRLLGVLDEKTCPSGQVSGVQRAGERLLRAIHGYQRAVADSPDEGDTALWDHLATVEALVKMVVAADNVPRGTK